MMLDSITHMNCVHDQAMNAFRFPSFMVTVVPGIDHNVTVEVILITTHDLDMKWQDHEQS